ncbi:MAG: AsnC family transcriptional regulator [Candidatus ainarchaeum sp.]|nr:AsnC family transcriptional regulator [Candidatus ainarchaeum sp.]
MQILDKYDNRILYELDADCRQTNKQIAKKVKLSEQAVAYRIERLQKNNIIDKFVLMVNLAKLGNTHYKLFLRLQNINSEKEAEFEEFIKKTQGVFWAVSTRGNYDYIISFLAKQLKDYKNFYNGLKNKFGVYIYSEDLVILTKAPLFTRSYLVENIEKKEFIYLGDQEIVNIDNKDERIIKALALNARASYIELSKKTKIKPDTIRNRMKKLKSLGVIMPKITIDPKKIGRTYQMILFTLQSFNEKILRDMEIFAQGHPPILYYVNCIGSHNVELEIETASDDETDFIIKSFKNYFPQYIKNYSVLDIKKELKLNFAPF